jgi:sec-independent protein translocase protein TatB
MFDLSFAELAVIGAVALVVIGPEKLPKVARTAGLLLGRAQRMVASVKADLDREMRQAELAQLQAEIEQETGLLRAGLADEAAHAPPEPAPGQLETEQPEAAAIPAPVDERQPDLFADPPQAAAPERDRR